MSIYTYRIFVSVAEHSSFVGAAEHLHLTPSAISHAITKLENTLSLSLFDRMRTGVKLTPDGEMLLPYARDILNAEERLSQIAYDIKGLFFGRICIGTVNSICTNWIPQIVKTFCEQYPDIKISICEGGYGDELFWLRSGFADMAFISTSVSSEDLDFIPLFDDRMMCVVHKDFIPINKDYIIADDVRGQSIIFQQDGYDAETLAVLRNLGVTTNVSRFAVASDHSIVALIESGLGVSMLPALVLKKIVHDARAYPVEPAVYRTIGIATLKKRPLSAAAQAMRSHIARFFSNMN